MFILFPLWVYHVQYCTAHHLLNSRLKKTKTKTKQKNLSFKVLWKYHTNYYIKIWHFLSVLCETGWISLPIETWLSLCISFWCSSHQIGLSSRLLLSILCNAFYGGKEKLICKEAGKADFQSLRILLHNFQTRALRILKSLIHQPMRQDTEKWEDSVSIWERKRDNGQEMVKKGLICSTLGYISHLSHDLRPREGEWCSGRLDAFVLW